VADWRLYLLPPDERREAVRRYHQAKLDAFVATAWKWAAFAAVVIVLGEIVEALT
jgi:hypothetical protein